MCTLVLDDWGERPRKDSAKYPHRNEQGRVTHDPFSLKELDPIVENEIDRCHGIPLPDQTS